MGLKDNMLKSILRVKIVGLWNVSLSGVLVCLCSYTNTSVLKSHHCFTGRWKDFVREMTCRFERNGKHCAWLLRIQILFVTTQGTVSHVFLSSHLS